jgi:hypothetical protein
MMISPATTALGFSANPNGAGQGDQLIQQRQDEIDEMKRKKLLGIASPATTALLGLSK